MHKDRVFHGSWPLLRFYTGKGSTESFFQRDHRTQPFAESPELSAGRRRSENHAQKMGHHGRRLCSPNEVYNTHTHTHTHKHLAFSPPPPRPPPHKKTRGVEKGQQNPEKRATCGWQTSTQICGRLLDFLGQANAQRSCFHHTSQKLGLCEAFSQGFRHVAIILVIR